LIGDKIAWYIIEPPSTLPHLSLHSSFTLDGLKIKAYFISILYQQLSRSNPPQPDGISPTGLDTSGAIAPSAFKKNSLDGCAWEIDEGEPVVMGAVLVVGRGDACLMKGLLLSKISGFVENGQFPRDSSVLVSNNILVYIGSHYIHSAIMLR